MQPLRQILLQSKKDSLLTEQQTKLVDDVLVRAARAKLQARRIFSGPGETIFLNDPSRITVEWYEGTGMSPATITLLGEDDAQADRTDKKPKSLQTYVIRKDWELPWRYGNITELEAEQVAEAGEQSAITEDGYVADGTGAPAGTKGLLNASGIQTFAANSWSAAAAAGWEARANDIVEAIAKLEDKGHYGPDYQLIVNPAQAKSQRKVTENAGGSAIKQIEEVLGGPLSQRMVSWAKCPAGKAYLREMGGLNTRLIIGLDLRNIALPRTGLNARGAAIEIAAVQVRRPVSIVEMTNVA